jgi:hypothetical protein
MSKQGSRFLSVIRVVWLIARLPAIGSSSSARERRTTMSKRRSRLLSMIGAFGVIALLCGALPGALLASDDADETADKLVGTWRVTLHFPGAPNESYSLMVFNSGGTMTEKISFAGVSGSSGVWKKIAGPGRFAATFEGFDDGDSDGSYDSRFQVRLTIQLLDDNRLTMTSTPRFLSIDGTTLLAGPFPVPGEGTRMRVIRE